MNYSKLILSGPYRETGRQTKGVLSAAGSEGFRFDKFYLKVDELKSKRSVVKILVVCRQDFSAGVFGGLEEIRGCLKALADSGKELYFYASSYGAPQLFLSSVCSHRLIHPMGSLRFSGLSWSFSFLKRLMRRYGIDAEILRRGRYKSAGDRFRSDNLDEEIRQQYQIFLESVMSVLKTAVCSGFGRTEAELDTLLDGRILGAQEAVGAGWFERVVTDGEIENEWKKNKDKEVKIRKISNKTRRGFSLVSRRIAVLVFEGAIIDGHSRRDPLLGQAIGSDSFIPQIRKLKDDRKIKAVVLRINSGGGSAFAAESITAELRALAEKKPLIISMAEIAGSGGYWMSCCGQKTFALPTTMTGSIGVISIYIAWYKLLRRLGITHDTVKIGEHADAGSPLRGLSSEERGVFDEEIGRMYDNFISMVADFRKLSKVEVDSLAQGRIWAGVDAVGNKLADQAGGLSDAVDAAAEASGLNNPVVKFYPEVQHGLLERLMMNASKEDDEAAQLLWTGAALNMLLSGSAGSFCAAELTASPAAVMEEVVCKWI